MNTNIIEQSAILIARVTHLPDRKHLPGEGAVRLVPQLASLLQLRLLLHQEEIVGAALLALASCLLHLRPSPHVGRPLWPRQDKFGVTHTSPGLLYQYL